jgi:hypothetical protein
MVLSKTMPLKMPVLINKELKMELVKFVTILVKLVLIIILVTLVPLTLTE